MSNSGNHYFMWWIDVIDIEREKYFVVCFTDLGMTF